jgi:hypothetical protein
MKPRAIARLVLIFALVLGRSYAQRLPGQTARLAQYITRHPAPTPALQPALQQTAQVQLTPAIRWEEKPLTAPQVSCADGLVTLNAESSTLAEVLRAIARCSGAVVDIPSGIGATRVATRLGPGPSRDLFAALLDGSLNYIILGSAQDPGQVRTVIVRPREAMAPGVDQQSAALRIGQPAEEQAPLVTNYFDENGVERLPSGLRPDEALLSPEELARQFEAARAQQRQAEGLPEPSDQPQQ